jgi:hypothetical protein
VAELVDAADSKSAVRKDVLVRFQSRALQSLRIFRRDFLFRVAVPIAIGMVDAADSKSAVRKDVLVRFQSRAQIKNLSCLQGRFFIWEFVSSLAARKNKIPLAALAWTERFSLIDALRGTYWIAKQSRPVHKKNPFDQSEGILL